jgi:hypothetical protein
MKNKTLGPVLKKQREALGLTQRELARQLNVKPSHVAYLWRDFAGNKALLARHNVKPREMKVLSQVNLLGKITAPRNFMFILNAIRQAVEEEEN